MKSGSGDFSIAGGRSLKMARAQQSADAHKLIAKLGNLGKKIEQEIACAKKEIAAAEIRVRNFEKLSRDRQVGKEYSQALQSEKVKLRNAKRLKERLDLRLEEVWALVEQATDLAERSSGESAR